MFEFLNRRKRRWAGSEDKHLGPLTFSVNRGNDCYNPKIGFVIDTGDDDEYSGMYVRIHVWRLTILCELPQWIQPYKVWVDTSKESWNKDKEGNRGYWDIHSKDYGIVFFSDSAHYYWGAQTDSSVDCKSGVYFYPFSEWKYIRHSLYDLKGKLWCTEFEATRFNWKASDALREAVPKVEFIIEDFDNTRLKATTHIEEREWSKGIRSFFWLKYFVKNKVIRSLQINLDAEMGPEKGSWKGGLVGTNISMLPGELHEEAFRRWCSCEQHSKYRQFKVQFIEKIEPKKTVWDGAYENNSTPDPDK